MTPIATLRGLDMKALVVALLEASPFSRDEPASVAINLARKPTKGWRAKLLAPPKVGILVSWSLDGDESSFILNDVDILRWTLPIPLTSEATLACLAKLPCDLAVLQATDEQLEVWKSAGYNDRLMKNIGHLGWGLALKGDGHDRWIVSRRWLAHGPFRVLVGAHDTTLLQFCDLRASGKAALAQAKPAHAWLLAGYMAADHSFEHDVAGIYTKHDRLLRIVINDRDVSEREMLDACVVRRDRRADRKRPIANVAYIFVDDKAAKRHLEALWLRGLECRVADGRGERRLDDKFKPKPAPPAWVKRLKT